MLKPNWLKIIPFCLLSSFLFTMLGASIVKFFNITAPWTAFVAFPTLILCVIFTLLAVDNEWFYKKIEKPPE